jgi:hypothetical protein
VKQAYSEAILFAAVHARLLSQQIDANGHFSIAAKSYRQQMMPLLKLYAAARRKVMAHVHFRYWWRSPREGLDLIH